MGAQLLFPMGVMTTRDGEQGGFIYDIPSGETAIAFQRQPYGPLETLTSSLFTTWFGTVWTTTGV